MSKNDHLSTQASICLLLALIGVPVMIEHPNWFRKIPRRSSAAISDGQTN